MWTCCGVNGGGVTFVDLPGLGYIELTALVLVILAASLFLLGVKLFRVRSSIALGLISLTVGIIGVILSGAMVRLFPGGSMGVNSWLSALDMARVDDSSTSVISWLDHWVVMSHGQDDLLEDEGALRRALESSLPRLLDVLEVRGLERNDSKSIARPSYITNNLPLAASLLAEGRAGRGSV